MERQPFAFAGPWDVWRKPDGTPVESFTVITSEPNELLRPIHNRMPVILRPQDSGLAYVYIIGYGATRADR